MTIKKHLKNFSSTVLNSYSQIFFSENKVFAIILVVVSFLDVWAGLSGIIAVITSNILAFIMGYNKETIKKGLYGFNSLLTGLGTGLLFQPSYELLIMVFFASILTLIITINLEGILTKYALPYLSVPFLFGIWAVSLSTQNFEALGLSERGIYTYNELYSIGGSTLVNIYETCMSVKGVESIKIYFLSLGAIFFQNNIFAGILIAIGLLYWSRIAFSLSLIGFYTAFWFYAALGADFSQLAYTFIGFNYILTSIAIGGFFVIPSGKSYLWTILLLPVTVILTASLQKIFIIWGISIYSLPFNIIVLLFIYALKLRYTKGDGLNDNFVRQKTPEKTLYLNKTFAQVSKNKNFYPLNLPFWGEWSVMQAHNGKYTHQNEWQHAWDFIILNNENKEFINNGDIVEDYFCYGKNIIAPAAGYIVELADGIEDNIIGEINTENNWGNSIVIKHSEYFYSQISHIKKGSLRIKKGDYVAKGKTLAKVGNSGHSPYPHLHFQVQATQYIGSKTINYPLSNYIINNETGFDYKIFGTPELNQKISVAIPHELLTKATHFIPGKIINVEINNNNIKSKLIWETEKDIYNQTYIKCPTTNSYAYFTANETGIYFSNFIGDKKSELFDFFSSFYNVKTAFYKNIIMNSFIGPNMFFNKIFIFFQDFIAPFFLFLKSEYTIKYIYADENFSPELIKLESKISKSIFNKNIENINFDISIKQSGIIEITKNKSKTITIN